MNIFLNRVWPQLSQILKALQMVSQLSNIAKILNTLPQIIGYIMTFLFSLKLADKSIFPTFLILWTWLLIYTKVRSLEITMLILFSSKQVVLVTELIRLLFQMRSTSILYLNMIFIFDLYNICICDWK